MAEPDKKTSRKTHRNFSDPHVHTPLLDAIREGSTISTACHIAGIARRTFYEHLRKDNEFAGEYEHALAECEQRYTQIVLREIETGARTVVTETRKTIKGEDGGVLFTHILERETIAPAGEAALAFLRRRFPKDYEPALASWQGKDKVATIESLFLDPEWSLAIQAFLDAAGLHVAPTNA